MKRKNDDSPDTIVHIDACGRDFKTRLSTLRDVRYFPNQLFAVFFGSNLWQEELDSEGKYFIDYDSTVLRHLFNLLRMPHLIHHLPVDIHKEVWLYSLEKWGFTESTLSERLNEKIYKETPLKLLVEQIKNQIQENEEYVIKTILRESGYYDSTNKTRHTQIYIPVDHYELPWKEDLGHHLMNPTNKASVIQQIHTLFTPLKIDINTVKSNAKLHKYQFASKDYCTSEGKHLILDLEFSTTKI